MTLHEHAFRAMGTEIRLLLTDAGAAPELQAFVAAFEATLTRFSPHSELSRLNADPRAVVPASPLLRRAVRVALDAAHATDGLVDPTLLTVLERTGYRASRAGMLGLPAATALAAAPARRPATPHPAGAWRAVAVDDAAGVIRRPPGTRLDLGGSAKGLCADLLAARLQGAYVIDCGGDLRVGDTPTPVIVASPFGGGRAATLHLENAAVATSGLGPRVWRDARGRPAHHLLDPATGRPAWTGLASATAVAPTAAHAEVLAKAAFLAGPARARRLLREHSGVLVHDDGAVESLSPIAIAA